jgi:DNA-binding LacI/PurR family transcriptional regulator
MRSPAGSGGADEHVGLVVADISNPFIGPVVRGIENNLELRDKMLFVAETRTTTSGSAVS